MFKRLAIVLTLLIAGAAQAAPSVEEILTRADGYRQFADSVKVVTRVVLLEDGQPASERLYHVYAKSGRRSLVVMKSAAERGQKVLMLDDKFWLLLPTTKRPIRITASQKLLGEAATGDVATLAWREDYGGEVVGEAVVDGVPALTLELASRREGSTYARIVLTVEASSSRPLRAELYLASGKLAKVARYELGELNGRPAIVRTVLRDRIQNGRETVLEIQAMEAAEIPDKVYNPAYLLRDNLEGW